MQYLHPHQTPEDGNTGLKSSRIKSWLVRRFRLSPPDETIEIPTSVWQAIGKDPNPATQALGEWLQVQIADGWNLDFDDGYVVLLRRSLFHRVPLLSRIRWRRFYICRIVVAAYTRPQYFVTSVDDMIMAWPGTRWRGRRHAHDAGSIWIQKIAETTYLLPPAGLLRRKAWLQDNTLPDSVRNFTSENIISNSTWTLVPRVARIDIDDLYARWFQEFRTSNHLAYPNQSSFTSTDTIPSNFSPMDLARLVCIDMGAIRGNYITGVLWKEKAEWYEGVVGPVIKWILLLVGGGAAIASVILSILRFINETPMS